MKLLSCKQLQNYENKLRYMHTDEEFQTFLQILIMNHDKYKRTAPKVKIHLGAVHHAWIMDYNGYSVKA